MVLQNLSFDEALYQTFNFIHTLEKLSPENLSDNRKQAIKIVLLLLSELILELEEKNALQNSSRINSSDT